MNRYEEWLERAKSSYEISLLKATISYLVY
jgi:hypothetical protein